MVVKSAKEVGKRNLPFPGSIIKSSLNIFDYVPAYNVDTLCLHKIEFWSLLHGLQADLKKVLQLAHAIVNAHKNAQFHPFSKMKMSSGKCYPISKGLKGLYCGEDNCFCFFNRQLFKGGK